MYHCLCEIVDFAEPAVLWFSHLALCTPARLKFLQPVSMSSIINIEFAGFFLPFSFFPPLILSTWNVDYEGDSFATPKNKQAETFFI